MRVVLSLGIACLPGQAFSADSFACASVLAPRACYERYLQAIQLAAHLRDLHPFLSSDRVRVLEKGLESAQRNGVDPGRVERLTLELLKRGASHPDRIREQRFEREASLLVDRAGLTVEVRLVIEGGTWRIADERFRSTPLP